MRDLLKIIESLSIIGVSSVPCLIILKLYRICVLILNKVVKFIQVNSENETVVFN